MIDITKNSDERPLVATRFQIIRTHISDAAGGWAGWVLAHPEFGSSVHPIPTRGADYTHHITACPPGFENLTASLHIIEVSIRYAAIISYFPKHKAKYQK